MGTTFAYAEIPQSFEDFRKGIMENYDGFKNRVLDHYADFLAGEWHEYEPLDPTFRYESPKPSELPVIEVDVEAGDDQKKELMASCGFKHKNRASLKSVKEPENLEIVMKKTDLYTAVPEELSAASGAESRQPVDDRIVSDLGLVSNYDGDIFPFYGMRFALPAVDYQIVPRVKAADDFALQWNVLDDQEIADELVPSIRALQKASGLSDYLIYEMLMAYADHKFPETSTASKMSLTHYLLTQLGLGARVALDKSGNPYMLLPFDEPVYGRSKIALDKTYYVFTTPGQNLDKIPGLSTPDIPVEGDLGKPLHLRMDGLTLPYNPYHYSFEHDGLKIEGEMNQNVIPVLYRYPNMGTTGYAASVISKEVRDDVSAQVKRQLEGIDPLVGADKLLSTIQYGFPYATDDEFHGFEKPYFFEEILYYPKSDCEDRAVFYSYLLWNALGLENDLIAYPMHEATAIRADSVWGGDAHYSRDGKSYYISDPTLLGAPTGVAMSQFENVEPVVDLSYSE